MLNADPFEMGGAVSLNAAIELFKTVAVSGGAKYHYGEAVAKHMEKVIIPSIIKPHTFHIRFFTIGCKCGNSQQWYFGRKLDAETHS